MPHINRIRVNNVKYNFGTQFYDDFVMRFSGQNTIYDLANGGGKSVLMLLLLQNLIPNCTLDEKQPIEKLFRSGNDNTTIHSLIEWKLNSCDIKNGFQYMTTGFCARKAKDTALEDEEVKETAAIEYFNYCIFYRDFQHNDILNLPLSNGQERITFNGLRNYLRDLDKKDFSVQVHIFDRKGDYQRFISDYGLYESEWEIIRGINKTEGHVRTYFETHYKTTRKVVEDLFIEEIIEKSFRNRVERGESETEIAQTLLDIKDKLVELSRKKGEMAHYDRQMEALESFQTRLAGLEGIYGKKAELEDELVKTYYTAKQQLAQKEGKLEETKAKTEQIDEKKTTLARNLENARIVEEEHVLSGLLESIEKVRREYELMEQGCRQKEQELKEKEGANDYYDYLEHKKQLEIQNNALYSISSNDADVLEELYTLAFNRRCQMDEELRNMEVEKIQQEELLAGDRQQLEQLDKEERQAESQAAVLESQEKNLVAKYEKLGSSLEELRDRSGLLLLESHKEQLTDTKKQMKIAQEEQASVTKQLEEVTASYQKMTWEKENFRSRLELAQQEHERAKASQEQFKEGMAKLAHMEEIYEQKGTKALLERILEAYRSLGAKVDELRTSIEVKEDSLGWENGAAPAQISEPMENLLTHTRRYYDENAQYGCDYLMSLDKNKRKELLEKLPYLPYSIIVTAHLLEISMDEKIRSMDLDGRIVPFVEKKALDKSGADSFENGSTGSSFGSEVLGNQGFGEETVFFALCDNRLFYDEEVLAQEIENLKKQLEEERKQLVRLEENAKVLEEDMAFLQFYMQQEAVMEQSCESYQEAFDKLKALHASEEADAQRLKELTEQKTTLEEMLQKVQTTIRQLTDKAAILEEIGCQYEEFVQVEKELADCRIQKASALKIMEEGLHNVVKLRQDIAAKEQILRNMDHAKRQLEEDWKNYRNYYKEGQYPVLEMDKAELESLFNGRKLAYEQKNADVSDKKQLIEAYEKAMAKCEEAIRYKGLKLEELALLHSEHRLSQTPLQQLMQEKSVIEREQDHLANLGRELADHQTKIDRQEGSLRHARNAYEEKFGAYEPLDIQMERLALFVKETKEQLQTLKNSTVGLETERKELEKECYQLTSMQEEMERMIENFGIVTANYEGILEAGISLKENYKTVRKAYERLAREEQSRREEFEKDKAKLMETLKMLGAYELAEEVGRSIFNPRTIGDVKTHMDNIGKTMECILLEKDRIGKGIENMEVIKDNFENRCLQTCSTIRESLERLPNLSAIRLDDAQVNMINLQIPYVKEEFYKERMSAYIDETVAQADTYQTAPERLRYIRNRLAWKRLFSVIVKDMDKMKLQLYKRERMKEQSRYLKYEEAVGSTGQSQGIYIQFLVSVINYIASMNARNADSAVLRKVVFLDNPFGAAKDVYIWEPIFKLLQANHVQLIVPARGATPAITGRFAVNYILGQKLVNGRQQTVVVDYRSETNSQQLEYKELEFEQGMLELE